MFHFFQEKLYLEKDFPDMGSDSQNLDASPKDLGISRADLWAFAALIALDEVQKHSRDLCEEMQYNLTCNDWSTACWSKFPRGQARKMFLTGNFTILLYKCCIKMYLYSRTV